MPRAFKPWKGNHVDKKEIRKNKHVSHLFLKPGIVTTNGSALKVEHGGNIHTIPLRNKDGKAFAVVKDPVRKDRLLVCRKDGKLGEKNYEEIKINHFFRGKETKVGEISVSKDGQKGEIMSFNVIPYSTRVESSMSPETKVRHKQALKLLQAGEYEKIADLLTDKKTNTTVPKFKSYFNEILSEQAISKEDIIKRTMLLDGVPRAEAEKIYEDTLKDNLRIFLHNTNNFEPETTKRYSYQKKSIGTLLATLAENFAKENNIKRLKGSFLSTSQGIFRKQGWKPVGDSVCEHYKKL